MEKHTQEKNYTHCPREMCETQLIRARQLKSAIPTPTFIELAKDGTRTELKNHYPQRRFEFNCAGQFYSDDVAKILCTNNRKDLGWGDALYITSVIGREKMLEYARGEFKDQDNKIMDEIYKMDGRRCYVPANDGGYYFMHPYMWVPKSISLGKFNALPKQERQRLLNSKSSLIEEFRFYFARPLYEKLLNGGQFYQHPKNLFAKVWHIASQIKADDELLSSPIFVQGYMRTINYLYVHGAGNKQHRFITVNFFDFLEECCPSLIKRRADGRRCIRDHEAYGDFISMVYMTTTFLDGLDFNTVCPPTIDEAAQTITFELDHPERVKKIHQKRDKELSEAKNKDL